MPGPGSIDGQNATSSPHFGILSGGGEADDGFAGAIRESVADVWAESGLDGAEAGKSFVAAARGFQQGAANVGMGEGLGIAGAFPLKQPVKSVQVIDRRNRAQESSPAIVRRSQ